MDKVTILDVNISNINMQQVLQSVDEFVRGNNQHYIVTPNPEFIVLAHRDKQFRNILNFADISVADGIGIIKMAKLIGLQLKRITGVDLVYSLTEMASEKGYSVYFLGGKEGTALKTAQKLSSLYPKLLVAGAESGGQINDPHQTDVHIIEHINQTRPSILFVALGHGKQEKWIYHNLDKITSVRVAIGVGGSFDYISGAVDRAPVWIQKAGFEWLYRLIRQPKRWKRILDATIIFPFLFFKKQLKIF